MIYRLRLWSSKKNGQSSWNAVRRKLKNASAIVDCIWNLDLKPLGKQSNNSNNVFKKLDGSSLKESRWLYFVAVFTFLYFAGMIATLFIYLLHFPADSTHRSPFVMQTCFFSKLLFFLKVMNKHTMQTHVGYKLYVSISAFTKLQIIHQRTHTCLCRSKLSLHITYMHTNTWYIDR